MTNRFGEKCAAVNGVGRNSFASDARAGVVSFKSAELDSTLAFEWIGTKSGGVVCPRALDAHPVVRVSTPRKSRWSNVPFLLESNEGKRQLLYQERFENIRQRFPTLRVEVFSFDLFAK